jgi:hypothetical protein
MRRPKPWLAIIWFFERGIVVSGWKLHELSGIAQSSAANLLRKFATVIRELLSDDVAAVSSALFVSVISKRSRETPAGKHPRAEEEFASTFSTGKKLHSDAEKKTVSFPHDQSQPPLPARYENEDGAEAHSCDEPDIVSDMERQVYALLTENPMHFDALSYQTELPSGSLSAALTMLELDGLIERSVGDYFSRKRRKPPNKDAIADSRVVISQQAAERVSEIMDFVSTTWRGISRKYLQNYAGVVRLFLAN